MRKNHIQLEGDIKRLRKKGPSTLIEINVEGASFKVVIPTKYGVTTNAIGKTIVTQGTLKIQGEKQLWVIADYFAIIDKNNPQIDEEQSSYQKVDHSSKNTTNEVSEDKEQTNGIICPECGSKMEKRTGKYGEFYGCTTFPKCKKTIPAKDIKDKKEVQHNKRKELEENETLHGLPKADSLDSFFDDMFDDAPFVHPNKNEGMKERFTQNDFEV